MKRFGPYQGGSSGAFGYARLVCLALLIGLAALRIADPAPVEELRVRTFDAFQRIDPAQEDRKAGHHRRYRRQEPGKARAVAVAADADRGSRHRTDPARRGRDRVRRRVLGARPAQPRLCGRHLPQSRRGNPRQAARAAEQRPDLRRRASRRSRVVLGESGLPEVIAALDKTLPVTGLAMLGEEPQRFMFDFPGLLRNVPVLEHAAAGRGLFTIKPERDGIVRRVPMIMQAQGADHAVADFRDAAGRHRLRHDPDQGRQGRHQEHRRQGLSRFRPTTTASSGFTSPATIPRSMSRRSMCWRSASRPT